MKTKFLNLPYFYCHREQTQINEGYCDISTDEEGATGLLATKAGKIKRPSVLQHLQNRHIKNYGHNTQHHRQLLEQAHTQSWQKTGIWEFTISCWEALFWVFSLRVFTNRRHNCKVFCFLPSKTANTQELTVPDGCTVRSYKPAWSCQELKYLETYTGLNQTERQACKRTSEKKMINPFDPLDENFSHGCMAQECLSN